MLEVEKGIEAQRRLPFLFALALIEREIDAQLGIGERRNENGDIVFDAGFQNAAPLAWRARYSPMRRLIFQLLTTSSRVPSLEHVINDFFDRVEIYFWLERIVDAIVAGKKSSLSPIFAS